MRNLCLLSYLHMQNVSSRAASAGAALSKPYPVPAATERSIHAPHTASLCGQLLLAGWRPRKLMLEGHGQVRRSRERTAACAGPRAPSPAAACAPPAAGLARLTAPCLRPPRFSRPWPPQQQRRATEQWLHRRGRAARLLVECRNAMGRSRPGPTATPWHLQSKRVQIDQAAATMTGSH